MANVAMICIGKLKEKYWQQAQAEYQKRLSTFCRLSIIEKKEASLPKGASLLQVQKACDTESTAILTSASGTLIALSPEGEKMSSEAFASMIGKLGDTGDISFAIGGSNGLSQEIKNHAAKVLSFSDMTMPHQLFRIVLLEQIYRAFMIGSGRTYHK